MSSLEPIHIGERAVGLGLPAYIIAEIGINHNGDMDLAKRMINAGREAGADAVKFQNYKTDDFVPVRNEIHSYVSQGKEVTEPQYDIFKRYELSDEQVVDLADYCVQTGVDFHSTPTNADGVRLLREAGVCVLKNGSDFLSNLPLIEEMAKTGLPTVLSTGMASLGDIDDAVRAFYAGGNQQLILLHCTSQYPAPANELNLKRIPQLRATFGCLSGFSDHSEGALAAALSVPFGACWIEKHFTLDRALPGPDHGFSSDPVEFAELVKGVRLAEAAMGTSRLGLMSQQEQENREGFRLSCAAQRDLPQGAVLQKSDITFYRPGTGIAPGQLTLIVGRRLSRAVSRGELFEVDMF